MSKRKDDYSWGEILDSFKKGIFGSDEDFDDDFEDVEVEKDEEPKSAEQKDKEKEESAKPVQKPASKPAQREVGKDSDSILCSTLQASMNTFVQTGQASDSLLQLLKEGFDKNPDLLEEIAKFVAIRRRGEERTHPGYLVSFDGEDLMFLTKEKALDHLLSHPGASVRETIFVSLVKDRKAVATREATEEEKKLYFEQKTSKADASGPESQDY